MDRKKKRLIGNIILSVTVVVGIILLMFTIRIYLNNVDEKTKEIMKETDATYTTSNNKINSNGLYVAQVKKELLDYLEDWDAKTITYKFEGEPFYLELEVTEDETGEKTFSIEKIVNEEKKVYARMNLEDVDNIEYRTGNANGASLLKINTEFYSDYFAITNENHYFLGSDIENVSFENDQFYYLSYNPNYRILDTAKTCSKDIKAQIDDFSTKDYYYKYGEINFLTDYYQKLSSKRYTVGEKCEELKAKQEKEKEDED